MITTADESKLYEDSADIVTTSTQPSCCHRLECLSISVSPQPPLCFLWRKKVQDCLCPFYLLSSCSDFFLCRGGDIVRGYLDGEYRCHVPNYSRQGFFAGKTSPRVLILTRK